MKRQELTSASRVYWRSSTAAEGHGQSPPAFWEIERIDAVTGHARITDRRSSIRHAAIAERRFDAVGIAAQQDGHLPTGRRRGVRVADDVRDDLADGGVEVRAPGGIQRRTEAAVEVGPELRQGRIDSGEVLDGCGQRDGDLSERLARLVRNRRAHPQPSRRDAARDRGW